MPQRLALVFPSLALAASLTTCSGSGGSSTSGGGAGPPVGASVLQFHNHINRDGFFVDAALTRAAATGMRLDSTFDGTVQGNVYASPLYVENGPGGKGAFYVVTEDDEIYALDEATGKPVWQRSMGASAAQSGAGCGNISPIGITGTPAIDLAARLIVFDAVTTDNQGNIATHAIHALSIDDGNERWKLDVTTVRDQAGGAFSPQVQNQRSAVLVVGGVAYVAYGGNAGDCNRYHGWLVGVPLVDPSKVRAYATPATAAGMWAPGGPASDGTNIFAVTGNREGGSSTAWAGSECVYRFRADLSFSQQSADYWVPSNWNDLDVNDVDLGGSGPLVVDAPTMTPSALVIALGKDGKAYLLDRGNLGGLGVPPLAGTEILSDEIINAAAWANVPSGTYVVAHSSKGGTGTSCPKGMSGDLVAFKLDASAASKTATVWCNDNQGKGSPIITTSDGVHDALVWTAGAETSDRLHAWDLETGQPVFTGGGGADKIPNVRRFTTPIAVHGRVLVAGDGKLYALRP
jgi:hypothetical protein